MCSSSACTAEDDPSVRVLDTWTDVDRPGLVEQTEHSVEYLLDIVSDEGDARDE